MKKVGIYLSGNPIFPTYSITDVLQSPSYTILDILIPEFMKNDDYNLYFLNKFYKRKFCVSNELKNIPILNFNNNIQNGINEFCKENNEINSFKFIHKNREKFLNYNIQYDEDLSNFEMIIINPVWSFMNEFYTIKLIYDCILKNIKVYIIDQDLMVDNLLKKWFRFNIELISKIVILSSAYKESNNFIHISYGYKKELELPINNNYLCDLIFVGTSKWSSVHNRIKKVSNWFNQISFDNKIRLYGNWEDYKNDFKNVEIYPKISIQENLKVLNLSKATIHFYIDYYKKQKAIVVGNRIYDAIHAGTCLFLTDGESLPPYLYEFKQFIVNDAKELNKKLKNMSNYEREQQILFQRNILQQYTNEFEFNKFIKYHNK